ncbi:MAG: BMP family protein [Armatimonadota bacterium]|nr:BMP family protein [Armatimonadota bacterium]MDR7448555.1 BMP family protein [Armatimonadota bacterium]MDR7458919.1 BMP family protein [Armatimonadota bacterium]MDR7478933.1 BMP family protein [Armatimonadota bacterium]MDR7488331.1 BMP family protein [Armatimonadota bacterium]
MAKGRVAALVVAVLLGALVGTVADAGTPRLRVAAALPGIITDKAWNQTGYEGLKMIEKELGAQIAYTERVAQPDQVEVMSDYARRGYDLVFGHGGEFDSAGKQVAARFPRTKIVINNGVSTAPNLATSQINHFQVSFLAGVVAGLMTKTNKIAAISAQKFQAIDESMIGLEQGAKYVNPRVQMFTSYTGDWDNVGKGKEAALAHIARGVDVLYPLLDHAMLGVIEAAKEKKVFVIGYPRDQLSLAPETVLTSAIENIAVAMLEVAKLVAAGKFQGKGYVFGIENPAAARLGRYGAMVPQRVRDRVEEVKKLLLAGKIQRK